MQNLTVESCGFSNLIDRQDFHRLTFTRYSIISWRSSTDIFSSSPFCLNLWLKSWSHRPPREAMWVHLWIWIWRSKSFKGFSIFTWGFITTKIWCSTLEKAFLDFWKLSRELFGWLLQSTCYIWVFWHRLLRSGCFTLWITTFICLFTRRWLTFWHRFWLDRLLRPTYWLKAIIFCFPHIRV